MKLTVFLLSICLFAICTLAKAEEHIIGPDRRTWVFLKPGDTALLLAYEGTIPDSKLEILCMFWSTNDKPDQITLQYENFIPSDDSMQNGVIQIDAPGEFTKYIRERDFVELPRKTIRAHFTYMPKLHTNNLIGIACGN